MKPKLAIFTKYVQALLPAEKEYLWLNCNLEDKTLKSILKQIFENRNTPNSDLQFSTQVDKRKYSYLKTWMQQMLEQADVDTNLKTIQAFELKVQSDSISEDEEKDLIKLIKVFHSEHYHFIRFYEVMLHFRQYLQVRMRKKHYAEVQAYVEQHRNAYHNSILVSEQLHQITSAIIEEYGLNATTQDSLESQLLSIVHTNHLDGLNRYAAAVRLWFYYMNKAAYVKMERFIKEVDILMIEKAWLGRRILVNFYANCLLLYSKMNKLEQAKFYGGLSLSYPTNDYLFYVINYSSVLLRMGEANEAMLHMKKAFPYMRHTHDNHNKIGFVAHYVHCLIDLGKLKEASRFAENYLGSHLKEVMQTRWHLFFAAYFRTLVLLEKFPRLLYIASRYKLREKEALYAGKAHYLPTMSWYISLAEFMEGKINENTAVQRMKAAALILINDPLRSNRIDQQLTQLYPQQPTLINKLKSELKNRI